MLKVDNISLYYGAAQALRGVSLTAEPGKVTCVLGRNGVGKTSLLRALVGQHAISSGSIKFDGTDLSTLKSYERARRGGDLSGGQQQQLAIGRALVMRPKLLLLDEPTEGIQPSIIKDIGRAISYLRSLKEMAIVLVEQYLDFAQELGDHLVVMDRGSIVYASDKENLDEGA